MIEKEQETCWERLRIATRSTAEKIRVRFNDNINFLEVVAGSITLTQNLENEERVAQYLDSVVEMTIFERLDVLLPDGSILTQTGEIVEVEGSLSYEELLEKGRHISPRRVSPLSGEEVIYYFTPIQEAGMTQALLIGTISCETLGEIFEVFTYGGDAQLYLIDCEDGNYLLDNWHDELGNIYELGEISIIHRCRITIGSFALQFRRMWCLLM